METLRAPFPWFGGKSRAAGIVWQAFGDVANYVEPFAGSLAVMLMRPHEPRVETVNDLDCYLANFWRAVAADPDAVAHHADWPVNEADLHARHQWLVDQVAFRERMKVDPEFHDARIAGWWVWGLSQWIGGGWCTPRERVWRRISDCNGRGAKGVHGTSRRRPTAARGQGVERKRPVIGRGDRGVSRQIPQLGGDSGAAGRGVVATGKSTDTIRAWMEALCDRLRRVRVCCGDWTRVTGPAVTTCIGVTGVLLDPPYGARAGRDPHIYASDDLEVADAVRVWAIEHGDDPKLRIALCGYEGEHEMPPTWRAVAWRAAGGYGNRSGNQNRDRERVWLSPHCLSETGPLFERRSA